MNKFEIVDRFFQGDISAMPNLPKRATANAAGYDFEVAEDTIVPPYARQMEKLPYSSGPLTLDEVAAETKRTKAKPTLVPTGIKCRLDRDCYLELTVRSSLPLKHWLILANGAGIVDSDYYENEDNDGEIFFQLINLSPYPILLKAGDRIGQGIIKHYGLVEDDGYDRGAKRRGGFGSTSSPFDTNVITTPYPTNELNENKKSYTLNNPIFYDNTDPLTFNTNDIVYTTTTTASTDDTYTVANSIPVDPNAVWCLNSKLPDIKLENKFQQLSFDDLEKMKDSLV